MDRDLGYVLLGLFTGMFLAFIFIPLSLWMDKGTGYITNFLQMWQSLGIVALVSLILGFWIILSKKRPERFYRRREYET
jgi:hypothetical protein